MRWITNRTGSHAHYQDLFLSITYDSNTDSHTFTIRSKRTFASEIDARSLIEDILACLEDSELVSFADQPGAIG